MDWEALPNSTDSYDVGMTYTHTNTLYKYWASGRVEPVQVLQIILPQNCTDTAIHNGYTPTTSSIHCRYTSRTTVLRENMNTWKLNSYNMAPNWICLPPTHFLELIMTIIIPAQCYCQYTHTHTHTHTHTQHTGSQTTTTTSLATGS